MVWKNILKRFHCLLTLFLFFIIGLFLLVYWMNQPHPHYHLSSEKEISKGIYLYEMDLERDPAGFKHVHYFLSEEKFENPAKALEKFHPFLETKQEGDGRPVREKLRISDISFSDTRYRDEKIMHLSVSFSGRIIYFHNEDYLNLGRKHFFVKINLNADYL